MPAVSIWWMLSILWLECSAFEGEWSIQQCGRPYRGMSWSGGAYGIRRVLLVFLWYPFLMEREWDFLKLQDWWSYSWLTSCQRCFTSPSSHDGLVNVGIGLEAGKSTLWRETSQLNAHPNTSICSKCFIQIFSETSFFFIAFTSVFFRWVYREMKLWMFTCWVRGAWMFWHLQLQRKQ